MIRCREEFATESGRKPCLRGPNSDGHNTCGTIHACVAAAGCPRTLRPPPDPQRADRQLDPGWNHDAALYFGAPGIYGPGSGAIDLHVWSGRGYLPGNAAPLHAATGDAHGGRSQHSRCGPDRNRCRRAPGPDSLGSRAGTAAHAAGDHGRNSRSRHAPADGVDARHRGCGDAPAIVPLHGVGHGGEANRAGDGSAPFLPSDPGKFYRTNFKYPEARPGPPSRIAQVGPQVPPAPLRFAARSGRSATGRAPPMGSHGGETGQAPRSRVRSHASPHFSPECVA